MPAAGVINARSRDGIHTCAASAMQADHSGAELASRTARETRSLRKERVVDMVDGFRESIPPP